MSNSEINDFVIKENDFVILETKNERRFMVNIKNDKIKLNKKIKINLNSLKSLKYETWYLILNEDNIIEFDIID